MKKTHMKNDEFEIIRAVSVDLGDGKMFVLSYQYHTELGENGKNDRSKSRYRMIGRIETKQTWETMLAENFKPENRMNSWKWPDDPSWNGSILYMKDATNAGFSNWIRLKIMKCVDWDVYLRLVAGYKKDVDGFRKAKKDGRKLTTDEIYSVFNPGAVYETEGYSCTDGTTVDVTDRESLKSKVGQTLVREIHMKLSGPEPYGKGGEKKQEEPKPAEEAQVA